MRTTTHQCDPLLTKSGQRVACSICGTLRDPWGESGQAVVEKGKMKILQSCITCGCKTWSDPFVNEAWTTPPVPEPVETITASQAMGKSWIDPDHTTPAPVEEWTAMPNGDLVRYAGIGEDGAMLVDVVRARPVENITVTEADSQTPETDEMGSMRRTVTEWRNLCENLERQRNEALRLFESSKRARKSLSDACDILQRQLAKYRKQLRWKQHRVEVLQRVGMKIVEEKNDLQQLAADMRNQRDRARAERDKLATACEHIAHSKLPADQLERFAIDALAAVKE